ncbi:MAG TPA: proprotein convertase P-domain-containing protein [Methylococcaceae bacterium]|nr:proprotein convertase P-domain-containing protein [Methylococcaceae bacterium]
MKRKQVLSLAAVLVVAAVMLLTVSLVQARWFHLSTIQFLTQEVCTDGIYFGVADSGPSSIYTTVFNLNNSVIVSKTVTTLPHTVYLPPLPENIRDYSVFSVLHWPTPLSVGTPVTITLMDRQIPRDVPGPSVVNNCSLGNLPGGTILHACSADVPGTLHTSLSSILYFPDNLRIINADLEMFVTHTYDSDVEATLISPHGTQVPLFNGIGGSGDNFGSSCGPGNINPNFYIRDDGDYLTDTNSFPPQSYYGTLYRPQSPLSALKDENAAGNWTLNLVDHFPPADDGQLLCWCLNVNGYYVNNLPSILKSN